MGGIIVKVLVIVGVIYLIYKAYKWFIGRNKDKFKGDD
jgi:threonine/homoserine/homoserine lactone efflux protein